MNQLLRNWQDTVSVLAAAGIAFIAVGWVAFHRPTHHEVPANIPYSQSLEYAYSAVPSDSRVYDTGVATPGEPVYRQLSSQVAFHIDYRFDAEAAALAGSYHLVAELGDQNGWKRTIELTPATPFSGAGFTAEGVLDLATAQSLISVLEEQGGVKNDRYSVHIRPQVEVAGTIRGARFEDSFDEPLTMSLDGVQLKMAVEFDNETPLAPRTDGLVATERTEANTIKLLVFTLPVGLARALAAAGMGFVLAASGSEVSLALEAADLLVDRGVHAAVISVMWRERLSELLAGDRRVLPDVPVVWAEAGVKTGWQAIARDGDQVIGLNRFGESGPGPQVAAHVGLTAAAIADAAFTAIGRIATGG